MTGFGFGAGGGPLWPMTDDGRELAGDDAPETAPRFFDCHEGAAVPLVAAAGAGGGARLTGAGAGGGGGGGAALGAGSRLDVND